jgi:hypothetical protein
MLSGVVTGWNYKDGGGRVPIKQYCYYAAPNLDQSSTRIDLASTGGPMMWRIGVLFLVGFLTAYLLAGPGTAETWTFNKELALIPGAFNHPQVICANPVALPPCEDTLVKTSRITPPPTPVAETPDAPQVWQFPSDVVKHRRRITPNAMLMPPVPRWCRVALERPPKRRCAPISTFPTAVGAQYPAPEGSGLD